MRQLHNGGVSTARHLPALAGALVLVLARTAASQAAPPVGTSAPPPTAAQVRAAMGIPSTETVRGQQDTVGFASTAEQMAGVWELSAAPPPPTALGSADAARTLGVVCPHDDYLYAGRVYRAVLPLVARARTVVLIGVFHKYRRFGVRDVLVFDTYRAWRSPDGEIPVSPLREAVLAAMSAGSTLQSAVMHDSEHSLEAVAYWLRHQRPDLEILPIIVPASRFERLAELARQLGGALARACTQRGLTLGRDVAVAISTDAVHYGSDFSFTPFGEGGVDAYARAAAQDEEILHTLIAGPVTTERVAALSARFVDPQAPDAYRLTWCGRFALPLGVMALAEAARAAGAGAVDGIPIAYATSVGAPELPVRPMGLGETAPANLYHFVGYAAAAFVPAT